MEREGVCAEREFERVLCVCMRAREGERVSVCERESERERQRERERCARYDSARYQKRTDIGQKRPIYTSRMLPIKRDLLTLAACLRLALGPHTFFTCWRLRFTKPGSFRKEL